MATTYTHPLQDCHVLVCEANFNIRHTVLVYLQNLRVGSVEQAATINEAESLLKRKKKIAIIICNWSWPSGKTGIDFCREIKRANAPYRYMFLLLADKSFTSDVVLAFEVGVDGYLVKPFDFDTFRDKLISLYKEQKNPQQVNVLLAEGFNHLIRDEVDQAEAMIKQVLELAPQSARANMAMGKIFEQRNHLEDALEAFKKSIRINVRYVEGYVEIIRLLKKCGQFDLAIDYALKLKNISPGNISFTLDMANIYLAKKDFPAAEKLFVVVNQLAPDLAEGYKGLGDLSYQRGEFEEALVFFEKGFKVAPQNISILNSLGLVYAKLGRHQKALDNYRIAVSIDSGNEKLYYNMGTAYDSLERYKEAVFCFKHALSLKPIYPKALSALKRAEKNYSTRVDTSDLDF